VTIWLDWTRGAKTCIGDVQDAPSIRQIQQLETLLKSVIPLVALRRHTATASISPRNGLP
jgi:hypothetical protein